MGWKFCGFFDLEMVLEHRPEIGSCSNHQQGESALNLNQVRKELNNTYMLHLNHFLVDAYDALLISRLCPITTASAPRTHQNQIKSQKQFSQREQKLFRQCKKKKIKHFAVRLPGKNVGAMREL